MRSPLNPFSDAAPQRGSKQSRPGGRWFLFLPGASLCALGLLILWVPDLLRFLIAGLLLLVGLVLLVAAWQMREVSTGSRGNLFAHFQQRVWRRFH